MSENTGILQVPIVGKNSENINNDTQKLVYVHIPKDKVQDISHVKVLPPKSNSVTASTANFVPLSGKISASPITTSFNKDGSLPTTFTITKSSKISGRNNITFSQKPAMNSSVNKARPPILGNKVTFSPSITSSSNVPINRNTKSVKVSLSSNRNFGSSAPTIFRTTTAVNTSNVNLCSQGSAVQSSSPLICSPTQVRSPTILSQVSTKPSKPVFFQSKILPGHKPNTSRVVPQKILPASLPNKSSTSNKSVVSYGPILPAGMNNSPDSSSLVKRENYNMSKREGSNFGSFAPPPLILQSGGSAKKLGNKKTGPTTISIVTGKSSNSGSGISVYPLSRPNNLNKPNMMNFKISNGQIQNENSVRFDGILCESRPLTAKLNEGDQGKIEYQESSTVFKKVSTSINKQMEKMDILQEAVTAMGSDLPEESLPSGHSESTFIHYKNDSNQVTNSGSPLPDLSSVGPKTQQHNIADSIPILISSKSMPMSGSAPVIFQGTMPVSNSSPLPVPVSVQNVIPVKVHPSQHGIGTTHSSPDVQGLIIRTDALTVRRKIPGKDDDRRDSLKPDLSIIPILRNSSLESKSSSSTNKSQKFSLFSSESFSKDKDKVVQDPDCKTDKGTTVNEDKFDDWGRSKVVSGTFRSENDGEIEDIDPISKIKGLLKWEDGMGVLEGSDLKFTLNEFDAIELVEDKALDEIKSQLTTLPKKDEYLVNSYKSNTITNIGSSSSDPDSATVETTQKPVQTTVHVHHARKPNLNRKEEENSEFSVSPETRSKNKITKNPYDICCCKNCGCYGLSSEFFKENGNCFCTIACLEDYSTKEAEWNKEKQRLEKSKNRLKKTKSCDKEGVEKPEIKIKEEREKEEKEKEKEKKEKEEKEKESIKESGEAMVSESDETLSVIKEDQTSSQDVPKFQHPWHDSKSNSFSWVKYLEHCGKSKGGSRVAPLRLWIDPFHFGKNFFKTGMKLEGIDPQHQSLFCVMTVVDVIGQRIRLHFDGYSDMYDFWCNVSSQNIFPVGWCEKNGRKLETPPGIFNFSWRAYLEHCKACPVPRNAFSSSASGAVSPPNNFRIGMKLEAEDRKNGWTCVATVSDLLDSRILVHFDGWDKAFDTWIDITSPFIHPIGWCAKNGVYLYPPKDYANPDSFNWHEYLQETNSMGVPARAFKTRPAREFKVDMKVEAVDKRNTMLVRVATIKEVKDYRVLLNFDGWPEMYDYWVDDDSSDIHPPTWCSKTGNPLQPPLTPEQCAEDVDSGVGCGTQGCKGYGHVKGLIYNTHHTAYGCPYSLQNLNKDWENLVPDRLEPPSKEKKKGKNTSKNFINLDTSKPLPEESEDSQRKRVRKRRKFFDELSPPEGSKPKIARVSSDEFGGKNQVSTLSLSKPSGSMVSLNVPSVTIAIPPNSSSTPQTSHSSFDIATSGKKILTQSATELNLDTLVHQSIFNPGYHPNPPPPIPHTLERHKHIISAIKVNQRSDVDSWKPEDVQETISKIPGCQEASIKLLQQDVDGVSLLMLTQNDLVELLRIKLGPAIKIIAVIFTLRNMP